MEQNLSVQHLLNLLSYKIVHFTTWHGLDLQLAKLRTRLLVINQPVKAQNQ